MWRPRSVVPQDNGYLDISERCTDCRSTAFYIINARGVVVLPRRITHSDGYLYGMIRNGRGLMPSYNRIEHMDRWDVVNYIRGLQGRLGRTVPTGPVGTPGETGDKVPGPTMMGPTRPAPHFQGNGLSGAATQGDTTGAAGTSGAAGAPATTGTRPPGGHQ